MYRFDWLSQNPVPGASQFVVGRDRAGRWIANDINGLNGEPFKDRASAIHYAELETALAPGAVQLVDGPLELRFGTPPQDKARKASV